MTDDAKTEGQDQAVPHERRAGFGRREEDRGRLVYSRGPIIRILEIASAISGLIAVGALILTVITASTQASQALVKASVAQAGVAAVQQSRQAAARDNCMVIRKLTFGAFGPKHAAYAQNLLVQVGLGDCARYSHRIRHAAHAR